jgi:hypothetical protein
LGATSLNDIDASTLEKVLKMHVVSGKVMAGNLTEGMTGETLLGENITFSLAGGPKITDPNGRVSNITGVDNEAQNGVVHVIDKVILPKQEEVNKKIIEPNIGFLDDLIVGDTASDGSRVQTVYILRRDAEYLVQGPFENHGWKLHIEAEEGTGKKPHVMPYPQADGSIFGNLMTLYGDGEFKNIFFDGRPQDQTQPACGRIWRSEYEGLKLDIEGCVLANCSQNGIMLPKASDYVKVNNCQFFNMGIIAQSDFGNGRVFDCRDSEINLFSLTNSTFVNSIDRIVRHRGGSGVMKEVIIDHNTVINNAAYHGFIELGNIGNSIQITNNLMYDCMGLGADQSDATRLSELDAHGETDGAGNPKMVWIGSIPNDSTTFTIHNNVYSVSAELQAFYTANGVDEGPIFTDHIRGKISDPDNAWVKRSVTLPEIPPTMTNFYEWYYSPDGANKQKLTTQAVNYDMKSWAYWTDELDAQYSVTDPAFMGSDNVPVGDPNWESSVITSTNNISLSQLDMRFYPNPFSNSARLQFNLEEFSRVSISIYDITGRLTRQIDAGSFSPGVNIYEIQKENMQNGIYLLKLDAGAKVGLTKIIVN